MGLIEMIIQLLIIHVHAKYYDAGNLICDPCDITWFKLVY